MPINARTDYRYDLTRREFIQQTSFASLGALGSGARLDAARGIVAAELDSQAAPGLGEGRELASAGKPIKLFCCDLNWVRLDKPIFGTPPAAPQDWAFINPKEYFEWHKAFGVNVMFCQAYTFGGYAFYPTNLGAEAPGPGRDLFPELL